MQKQILEFGWKKKDSLNAFFCFIICLSAIYSFTISLFAPIGFVLFGFTVVAFFLIGIAFLPVKFLVMPYRKKIRAFFFISFFTHLLFLVILYIYYFSLDGTLFGPNAMDVTGYHLVPKWMAEEYSSTGTLNIQYYLDLVGSFSDMGYIFWMFFWYTLFGSDLWLHGLLNIIFASFSAVLVYKITLRQFGEKVGILAAIMMLLHPFFIYYNSIALKETIMLWLVLMFFKQAQAYFIFPNRKALHLVLALLSVLMLTFFRNFLAIVLGLGFLIHFLFNGVKRSRSINIFISIITFIGFYYLFTSLNVFADANTLINISGESFDSVVARRTGNSLVERFTSLPAFIVLAFSGPFPTIVNIPDQESILLQMGGAFLRNLMVPFSMFSIWFVFKKELRQNLMYLFFIFAYLFIVAYSGYGNSMRYNLVVLPILLIYTAKGIQDITFNQRKVYHIYLFILVLVILMWNYSKLAGRGII